MANSPVEAFSCELLPDVVLARGIFWRVEFTRRRLVLPLVCRHWRRVLRMRDAWAPPACTAHSKKEDDDEILWGRPTLYWHRSSWHGAVRINPLWEFVCLTLGSHLNEDAVTEHFHVRQRLRILEEGRCDNVEPRSTLWGDLLADRRPQEVCLLLGHQAVRELREGLPPLHLCARRALAWLNDRVGNPNDTGTGIRALELVGCPAVRLGIEDLTTAQASRVYQEVPELLEHLEVPFDDGGRVRHWEGIQLHEDPRGWGAFGCGLHASLLLGLHAQCLRALRVHSCAYAATRAFFLVVCSLRNLTTLDFELTRALPQDEAAQLAHLRALRSLTLRGRPYSVEGGRQPSVGGPVALPQAWGALRELHTLVLYGCNCFADADALEGPFRETQGGDHASLPALRTFRLVECSRDLAGFGARFDAFDEELSNMREQRGRYGAAFAGFRAVELRRRQSECVAEFLVARKLTVPTGVTSHPRLRALTLWSVAAGEYDILGELDAPHLERLEVGSDEEHRWSTTVYDEAGKVVEKEERWPTLRLGAGMRRQLKTLQVNQPGRTYGQAHEAPYASGVVMDSDPTFWQRWLGISQRIIVPDIPGLDGCPSASELDRKQLRSVVDKAVSVTVDHQLPGLQHEEAVVDSSEDALPDDAEPSAVAAADSSGSGALVVATLAPWRPFLFLTDLIIGEFCVNVLPPEVLMCPLWRLDMTLNMLRVHGAPRRGECAGDVFQARHSLRLLNLSSNYLETIPGFVLDMRALEVIHLGENPLLFGSGINGGELGGRCLEDLTLLREVCHESMSAGSTMKVIMCECAAMEDVEDSGPRTVYHSTQEGQDRLYAALHDLNHFKETSGGQFQIMMNDDEELDERFHFSRSAKNSL
ncbi:hypothetical protein CYMTET_17915 [Cymbomonas tetramitiformis]|uniref:Uncharacterized protein n=1 Tax=Cymbomonas tetramitiformis TaxID=36881 RepID=A0AAE0G9L6_9CHLO|nr:hypothetical protein CYMTET_17915 [Cymbomonas tetramitiformis]|eukprot:gene17727-21119_t